MPPKCPKCGSSHVDHVDEQGVQCLICLDCGYDEHDALQTTSEERNRQKGKSTYSPYKTGGSKRTQR